MAILRNLAGALVGLFLFCALCFGCYLYGEHAERESAQAKLTAAEKKAAELQTRLDALPSKADADYTAAIKTQTEKAYAQPKIVLQRDCAVPAAAVRVLNDAASMPGDARPAAGPEKPAAIADATCAAELELARRNYAEVCVPNAIQLQAIQAEWQTVREAMNHGGAQ